MRCFDEEDEEDEEEPVRYLYILEEEEYEDDNEPSGYTKDDPAPLTEQFQDEIKPWDPTEIRCFSPAQGGGICGNTITLFPETNAFPKNVKQDGS